MLDRADGRLAGARRDSSRSCGAQQFSTLLARVPIVTNFLLGPTASARRRRVPSAATALRVQSSAYGLPRPFGYGQARIAGNVIWYGNFTPTLVTQGAGGKGGGGGAGGKGSVGGGTYVYSAGVVFALCEGPVAGVLQAWENKSAITLPASGSSGPFVTSYKNQTLAGVTPFAFFDATTSSRPGRGCCPIIPRRCRISAVSPTRLCEASILAKPRSCRTHLGCAVRDLRRPDRDARDPWLRALHDQCDVLQLGLWRRRARDYSLRRAARGDCGAQPGGGERHCRHDRIERLVCREASASSGTRARAPGRPASR